MKFVNQEFVDNYNRWADKGIYEFEPCKEAIAYVTDSKVECLIENIQLVASNVIVVCCIGEILKYYKEGTLDKKKLTGILIKYGLATLVVYLVPILFEKYF